MSIRSCVMFVFLAACSTKCSSHCGPSPIPKDQGTDSLTQVSITNQQEAISTYFAFGADSAIGPDDWKATCTKTGPLTCTATISKGTTSLPNPSGKYLNVTIAFGAPVGCGVTKAEINVNNSTWYDTLDVSLVDGFNQPIEIVYTPPGDAAASTKLGPPNGRDGNETVLGVFPYGCDACVARLNPPCGISKGTEGCKKGTQYKPDVPCQTQGAVKGGGGTVEVILRAGIPATTTQDAAVPLVQDAAVPLDTSTPAAKDAGIPTDTPTTR